MRSPVGPFRVDFKREIAIVSAMEQFTTFVSSRGILRSCTAHNKSPVSSTSGVDEDLLDAVHGPLTIYVCTDALAVFAIYALPKIKHPFTLVTGDSDRPVEASLLSHPNVLQILENEHLVAWFAQNLLVKAPKLHHLPIGQDYHTMQSNPNPWGLGSMSPLAQERALVNTLVESPSFEDRELRAYCNWHFEGQRGDREECFNAIDHAVCFFEPTKIPRGGTWARQAQMMFVISPFGRGFDCHRTWEALALGCVPILRRSGLSPVFEGLPCVFVDDWREVNGEFLAKSAARIASGQFNWSPMFREHWVRRFLALPEASVPKMGLKEMRSLFVSRA